MGMGMGMPPPMMGGGGGGGHPAPVEIVDAMDDDEIMSMLSGSGFMSEDDYAPSMGGGGGGMPPMHMPGAHNMQMPPPHPAGAMHHSPGPMPQHNSIAQDGFIKL